MAGDDVRVAITRRLLTDFAPPVAPSVVSAVVDAAAAHLAGQTGPASHDELLERLARIRLDGLVRELAARPSA